MPPRVRGRRGYQHSSRHGDGSKTRHFSSVLNQETILLGKLVIPDSFVTKCGRSLSTPVLLKVDHKIWQVRLREHGGMLWMCTGMSKIFKKYSLEEGYTLLFGYKGNSLFYVSILDSTGMGIDPSSRLRARSRSPSPDSEDTEMDIENSSEEDIENSSEEETSDVPSESLADEEETDIKSKEQKNRAASSLSKTVTGASGDGTFRVSGEAEEAEDQFDPDNDDHYQMESSDSVVNKAGGFKQPSTTKDTAAGPSATAGKGEWDPYGTP